MADAVMAGLVAALDVGGTKIAGGLVDDRGRILARTRRPTPPGGGPEDVMAAVAGVFADLAASPLWPAVRAVGIGSAGPVDGSLGLVSPVNIPGWRDFPLVRRVSDLVGPMPVVLGGDGVAIAAAEHWMGAARGAGTALCMVVSTGVGGGLVLDGRLHPGPTGNAGHIGHITVNMDGEPCPCGSRGCLEVYASGPSIAAWATRNGWLPPNGEPASAAMVAAAADRGDPVALAAFRRAGRALAAAIAATAALTEVRLAVIGGGVAQSGPTLFTPLREHLADYATLAFTRDIEIRPARLGTEAGLVGAAALVLDPRSEHRVAM